MRAFIPRRRKIAHTKDSTDTAESSDATIKANNVSTELMWLRDLLPQYLPSARIASSSYNSDWRQDVKINFRKCGTSQ